MTTLTVDRLQTAAELESLRTTWNELAAGAVFQQWQWLHTWWQVFQSRGELYVLKASDRSGRVVGIAPWFLDRSLTRGRRLLSLGSGIVCSDYQALLVDPAHHAGVVSALADWLITVCEDRQHAWDELDLEAVDERDEPFIGLADCLSQRGLSVHWRPQLACWAVPLPAAWEQWLPGLPSSNKRRKLSKLHRRYVESQRAVLHRAETLAAVQLSYQDLVELHQRRWTGKQYAGCFADSQFTQFLGQVVARYFESNQLSLYRLEIDGRLAAVSCCLTSDRYCGVYQCGMDPEQAEHEPGWLLNLMLLRDLIARGFTTCDYLRGDESYKLDLGGQMRPQRRLRVAAPHPIGRLRRQVWLTQDWLRRWGDHVVDAVRGSGGHA